MPQVPSPSAVAVRRADGVVIIAVHGELGPLTASEAREQIVSVIATRPHRLVLNLVDLGDRFGAECLALIAVTQHLLPAGTTLEVCTSSMAVQRILGLADWSEPDPAARPCLALSPGSSECTILGMPRKAAPCAGPVRAQQADSAGQDTSPAQDAPG
jgi:anti-anti-sigma regulatory factor